MAAERAEPHSLVPEAVQRRMIFLCGSVRAGTTMTRLMLSEHSQIDERGEQPFLFDGVTAHDIETGGTEARRQAFRDGIAASRVARLHSIAPPALASVPEMIAAMVQDQLDTDAPYTLITWHRNYHLAALMFPSARWIHLARDPRDVAVSVTKMGWTGNPYFGVDVWRQHARDWAAAEPLIGTPVIRARFEEVTADPRGEMGRLLGQIGLDFEEGVLSPPGQSTYAAPDKKRAKAWESALTAREAGEIDWRRRDVPDEGYAGSPVAAGFARRVRLAAGNKAGRMRHGAARYGAPLFFGEMAARRLKLNAAHAPLRLRMQEIQNRHLK